MGFGQFWIPPVCEAMKRQFVRIKIPYCMSTLNIAMYAPLEGVIVHFCPPKSDCTLPVIRLMEVHVQESWKCMCKNLYARVLRSLGK